MRFWNWLEAKVSHIIIAMRISGLSLKMRVLKNLRAWILWSRKALQSEVQAMDVEGCQVGCRRARERVAPREDWLWMPASLTRASQA